jgi:hypothetical protein
MIQKVQCPLSIVENERSIGSHQMGVSDETVNSASNQPQAMQGPKNNVQKSCDFMEYVDALDGSVQKVNNHECLGIKI